MSQTNMPFQAATENTTVPLCIDLDGTLIKTDLVWESLMRLLRQNPLYAVVVPIWLLAGRARLKERIAQRVDLDVASLPYHQELIEYLRAESQKGRRIILATASDKRLAQKVADHVGLFTDVLASDGKTNLRGAAKGEKLCELFGKRGFDYAGNSSVDLPVWEQAREALVVAGSDRLEIKARERTTVSRVFNLRAASWQALVEALRPHQWVKNLILFVPLITAHKIGDMTLSLRAVLAFIAFSLCASGVYVLNDLFDLEADRQHSLKRSRPFASGGLPLSFGLVLFGILLGTSIALGWALSWTFALVLAVYVLLTTSYSWRVKQMPLLDVFFLAALYTIRLVAGHEATRVESFLRVEYSFWLLVFSMFIFLSLALVKRYVELDAARRESRTDIKGRGYASSDLDMVATLGSSSGYLAVLVLALYVNSDQVRLLYDHPILLLLICPLLLYWVSRVWMIAHRGQMHDDPIVFALKDPASYLIGALSLGVLWLASGR